MGTITSLQPRRDVSRYRVLIVRMNTYHLHIVPLLQQGHWYHLSTQVNERNYPHCWYNSYHYSIHQIARVCLSVR